MGKGGSIHKKNLSGDKFSSSSSSSKKGVRRVACSLILKVNLISPSLPRSS